MQRTTPRNSLILLLIIGFVFSALSCAKKPLQMGRENPELEINKCVKLSEKGNYKEAVECLEIFKSRFPKSQWGAEAELFIGDTYFKQKEYLLAADSYQAFIKLNPMHPKLDYAYYRSGLSYLKESPKAIDRDQQYLDASISDLDIMIRNFPSSPYLNVAKQSLVEARTRVARRQFYVGNFYYRTGEYIAAIPRFKEVYDKYQDSGLAPRSLYLTIVSNIKLKRMEDAKIAFGVLSNNYPSSPFTKKAEHKLLKSVKKGV